jgi:hypothetical protein
LHPAPLSGTHIVCSTGWPVGAIRRRIDGISFGW